jgi:hypothetical protein
MTLDSSPAAAKAMAKPRNTGVAPDVRATAAPTAQTTPAIATVPAVESASDQGAPCKGAASAASAESARAPSTANEPALAGTSRADSAAVATESARPQPTIDAAWLKNVADGGAFQPRAVGRTTATKAVASQAA